MTKKRDCEFDCPRYKTCDCGGINFTEDGDIQYSLSSFRCTAGPKVTHEEYLKYKEILHEKYGDEPLVFNVDVGKMPIRSAEKIVKDMMDRWNTKKYSG